jgi:hypothetical protein
VQRGIKAVNIIYSMTSRIPQLMKQSHLENNEGRSIFRSFCKAVLLTCYQHGLRTGCLYLRR